MPLSCWNGHQVLQFLELALREGDCPYLFFYNTPEDLIDASPSSLHHQELLDTHQVFGFPRK